MPGAKVRTPAPRHGQGRNEVLYCTTCIWKLEATETRTSDPFTPDLRGQGTRRASPRPRQSNKEGNTSSKTGSSTPFSGKEEAARRTPVLLLIEPINGKSRRPSLATERTPAAQNPRLRTSRPQPTPCSRGRAHSRCRGGEHPGSARRRPEWENPSGARSLVMNNYLYILADFPLPIFSDVFAFPPRTTQSKWENI